MTKEIRLTEEQLRRIVESAQDDDGSVNLLSFFNLGHVSKEELERQYIDLSEVSKFIGYTGRFIREDADGIIEEEAMATQTVDDHSASKPTTLVVGRSSL